MFFEVWAHCAPLAWVQWVWPNPSIFRGGFSNPSLFGGIQLKFNRNTYKFGVLTLKIGNLLLSKKGFEPIN